MNNKFLKIIPIIIGVILLTGIIYGNNSTLNYNPFYTNPEVVIAENTNEFSFQLINNTKYDLHLKYISEFCKIDTTEILSNTTLEVNGICYESDVIYIYGIFEGEPVVKTKLKIKLITNIILPPQPPIINPEPIIKSSGGRNLLQEGLTKYGESYFIILKELNKARKEYPDKIIHSFYWKNSRTYDITYAIENNSYKIIKSIKI